MSNPEIMALIDAVLALPVSDSTRSDLRSFRSQVQAGTISDDDRNYIIKLCQRLQRAKNESFKPSLWNEADDKWARENAEARRKRIACHRDTGRMFESTDDLRWLYFDLALRGALGKTEVEKKTDNLVGSILSLDLQTSPSRAEDELRELVHEPLWEAAWWDTARGKIDSLTKQAAHYIDRPQFHCTALRDFFITRLTESLLMHVRDPIKDRLVVALRPFFAGFLIALAVALYVFVSWWAAAIVAFVLVVKAWGWLRELDYMHKCKVRNQFTRNKINGLVAILKRGGFDEATIIRQLEILDHKIPPLPTLVYIYGCPYLLGSNQTGEGIQEHTIPVPDVLYALLRLPRRNVQNEITSKVFALDERKREELTRRWRKFIDPMMTYDEPQASRA